MPWGRLDDTWYDHPKLEELGDDRLAGAGLNTIAWSWSNRFLTDGRVPRQTVAKLGGTIELAEALVRVGLWDAVAGEYEIHDFLIYNDSREQVLKRRADEAKRKAEWRARTGDKSRPTGTTASAEHDVPPSVPSGHVVPPGHDVPPGLAHAGPRARATGDVARIPTRPDPTRPTDRAPSTPRTRGRNGAEPTLSKAELSAWSDFGSEWDAFRLAWIHRGFRLPPAGDPDGDDSTQRGLLYQILDARPTDLVGWVAAAPGSTPRDVIAWILAQWHGVRAEAAVDDMALDVGPGKVESAQRLGAILERMAEL